MEKKKAKLVVCKNAYGGYVYSVAYVTDVDSPEERDVIFSVEAEDDGTNLFTTLIDLARAEAISLDLNKMLYPSEVGWPIISIT